LRQRGGGVTGNGHLDEADRERGRSGHV
jgi:hypothetical protein